MENKNIPDLLYVKPKKSLFHCIWNKIAITALFIAFVIISLLIFFVLIGPFLPIYAFFKYYIFTFLGEDVAMYGAGTGTFITAWMFYIKTSLGNKIISPVLDNWQFEKIADMLHLDTK